MSGGSYDYLCWKLSMGLLTESDGFSNLERMAQRLEGLEWAENVVADMRSVISRAYVLDAELRQLEDVAHAVEWWDSCDWVEAQVRDVFRGYAESKEAAGVITKETP